MEPEVRYWVETPSPLTAFFQVTPPSTEINNPPEVNLVFFDGSVVSLKVKPVESWKIASFWDLKTNSLFIFILFWRVSLFITPFPSIAFEALLYSPVEYWRDWVVEVIRWNKSSNWVL